MWYKMFLHQPHYSCPSVQYCKNRAVFSDVLTLSGFQTRDEFEICQLLNTLLDTTGSRTILDILSEPV